MTFAGLLSLVLAQGSGEDCSAVSADLSERRNGTNVVVASDLSISYETYADLPGLPKGIRTASYGVPLTPDADGKYGGFDGVIKIGGIWSLTPGTSWYRYSQQMRRCQMMAIDFLNLERGGITVGGLKYGVHAHWVDDKSSKSQVTNATAMAGRGWGAHFLVGGYSSGLTTFTTKQSFADNYILLAPGAASTSVFTQNDQTFGTFVPASSYFRATLTLIAEKAAAIDAGTATSPFSSRCASIADSCLKAVKVGFLQAGAVFTRSMCSAGGTAAASEGLDVATDADGATLIVEVPKAPSMEQTLVALNTLKDAGVTVIISCTYSSTGNAVVAGLLNMSWAPLAVGFSSTVGGAGYAAAVNAPGGYVYEYIMGYSIWQAARQGTGAITGWTSAKFESEFMARFEGTKPSYHGASAFVGPIIYAAAIEAANSLNTSAVNSAIKALNFDEFYAKISFDSNGQLAADMMTIQFVPNSSKVEGGSSVDIVYPASAASADFHFPMPEWPIRHCWDTCSDVSGHCAADGSCVCDDGYEGINCDQRVIIVQDNTSTYVVAGVLGPIVFLLFVYGFYRIVLFVRAAIRLKAEDEMRKIGVCKQAIKAATTLQSTAYLISFKSFKKMGQLKMHEEAREAGLFVNIDDYEELIAFATANPVVFFSHQWLAWASPDPDKIQYEEMLAAANTLCEMNGYDPDNLYIFLDILSIPQKNMRLRVCAIETLGCFASIFEHFVIIAPDAVHKDTKKVCNKATYGRRGWCRLEQWGHLSVAGTEGMYYYNGRAKTLEPISASGDDWFRDSIMVLGGDYTINTYEAKKELVTTILGLYAMVLNGRDGSTRKLYELIQTNIAAVFPIEFFGDLPGVLKKFMESEGEVSTHHRVKSVKGHTVSAEDKKQLATLTKSARSLQARRNVVGALAGPPKVLPTSTTSHTTVVNIDPKGPID